MKYLLLFCGTREEFAEWQATPEEARILAAKRTAQWMDEHSAQVRLHNGLHLPHTVTSVHVGANGLPLVTDGPFLEGTEVIGGFAIIEVADLDEALQLARMWWVNHTPVYSIIQIWPMMGGISDA